MREKVIKKFKQGESTVLVATDIAARGLDVKDISHVFNYHISFDGDSYVHRIGRTGRAGKKGIAISIITPNEYTSIKRIEKSIGKKIENRKIPIDNNQQDRLLQMIRNQEINPLAYEFLKPLKEQDNLSTICYKLISLLHSKLNQPQRKVAKVTKITRKYNRRSNRK